MTHPVIERYKQVAEQATRGDSSAMADLLDDDVVWHEAGNPQPLRGKQAVMDRMSAMTSTAPELTMHSMLADDEHLSVFGHAEFRRDGESCGYDYVEEMRLRNGRVVERWSFMDAVPDDVARFFSQL